MFPLGLRGVTMRTGGVWCALMLWALAVGATPAWAQDPLQEWQAPEWLMTPEQANDFARREKPLVADKAKRSPQPSAAERASLQKIVSYYLSQLTFPDDKDLPKVVTEKLVGPTEILSSLTTEAARQVLLEDIVRKAPDLLTHPSSTTRLNVVLLLGQLSVKPADLGKKIPAIPYVPAHKVLAQVVQDSSQTVSARIAAARGLGRISEDAEPMASERQDIGTALVMGLNQSPVESSDGVVIFRFRCVWALGRVGLVGTAANQSLMIDKLMEVMVSPREHWLTRSESALAISRLQLTPSVNLHLVVHETCKLLQDMNAAYSKTRSAGHWRGAYTRIYLSFKPETPQHAQRFMGWLYQVRRPGLGNSQTLVEEAFQVVVPVVRPVMENTPPQAIPADAAQALRKFIDDNPPTNRRPTPTSKELGDPASQPGGSNT